MCVKDRQTERVRVNICNVSWNSLCFECGQSKSLLFVYTILPFINDFYHIFFYSVTIWTAKWIFLSLTNAYGESSWRAKSKFIAATALLRWNFVLHSFGTHQYVKAELIFHQTMNTLLKTLLYAESKNSQLLNDYCINCVNDSISNRAI